MFHTGQQKVDDFCRNILTECFSESNMNQLANGIYKQNLNYPKKGKVMKTCSLTFTETFEGHLRSGRDVLEGEKTGFCLKT